MRIFVPSDYSRAMKKYTITKLDCFEKYGGYWGYKYTLKGVSHYVSAKSKAAKIW